MTVISGFAAINEFWECGRSSLQMVANEQVQQERIRHIYAQTDVGPLPSVVAPKIDKTKKNA